MTNASSVLSISIIFRNQMKHLKIKIVLFIMDKYDTWSVQQASWIVALCAHIFIIRIIFNAMIKTLHTYCTSNIPNGASEIGPGPMIARRVPVLDVVPFVRSKYQRGRERVIWIFGCDTYKGECCCRMRACEG